MKRSITLTILCATSLLCAFGQSAPVNTVAGMGYLYPPTIVAPGQLITIFLQGNVQGDISATVSGFSAPVLEVRPGSSCPSSALWRRPDRSGKLITAVHGYSTPPPAGWLAAIHRGSLSEPIDPESP
jgi:hypothetical protein